MTYSSRFLYGALFFCTALLFGTNQVRAQVKPNAEMIRIPGGTFDMGASGGAADEQPVHSVTVPSFFMAAHEVTVADFAAFVTATGFTPGPGFNWYVDGKLTTDPNHTWQSHGFAQADTHPVVCVSWTDAQAYITWLNEGSEPQYRLPTEAEWEYVARLQFPEGVYTNKDDLCDRTNTVDDSLRTADTGLFTFGNSSFYDSDDERFFNCDDGHVYTSPVGMYDGGVLGVYDILGNAWELIQDCGLSSYETSPRDGSAYEPGTCERRVIRGGSWNTGPAFMTVTNRSSMDPDGRNWGIGFRLAADD